MVEVWQSVVVVVVVVAAKERVVAAVQEKMMQRTMSLYRVVEHQLQQLLPFPSMTSWVHFHFQ